jgi:hypothetical protein
MAKPTDTNLSRRRDMKRELNPAFAAKLEIFEAKLAAAGMSVPLVCGYRSAEEQARLYNIGRRGVAKERVVTYAKPGSSYHNFGLAADYWVASLSPAKRLQFGRIAESLGLTWGGRWRMADIGHVEWRLLPLSVLRKTASAATSASQPHEAAAEGRSSGADSEQRTTIAVEIVVDGKPPLAGLLRDGQVWAPVRPLAESLGAAVADRIAQERRVYIRIRPTQ